MASGNDYGLIGGILGWATDTLGISDIWSKASADRSYEMNRRLQKHDQAFQKEMRATAYQTMVDDMEKAGINPAVALSNGGGTVMGGSSSASATAPQMAKLDSATAMTNLWTAKKQIQNQTALTNADVELKKAQAIKELKDAGYKDLEIKYFLSTGTAPGATNTISTNFGALTAHGGVSKTTPITMGKNQREHQYKMDLAWQYIDKNKITEEKYKKMKKKEKEELPTEVKNIMESVITSY